MEPRARSQETDSEQERELSDYCCRQWLASVWGREKKRVKEREPVEREKRGREGACSLKAQKVARFSLSHRKTLVWRRHRGVFFTPVLHMSFTHSFKQYSLLLDCISDPKTMKRQILHASLLVCWILWLCTHTAPGHCFFSLTLLSLSRLFLFSSSHKPVLFCGWFFLVPDKRILVCMH